MRLLRLHRIYGFFLLVISLLFVSCGGDDEEKRLTLSRARQTVVFYMAAENSLYNNMKEDFEEILKVSNQLKSGQRVVLYVDGISLPCFYVIDSTTVAKTVDELTPRYVYGSDFNSCDPNEYSKVLNFVRKHYPSDHYSMVMWSHGTGWLPSTHQSKSERKKTFGVDNMHDTYSNLGEQMEIADLALALSSFEHLDFLMFDACNMQNIEVAYELRNYTDYIIASPAELPIKGAPYDIILPMMFEAQFDPSHIVTAYADNALGWTNNSTLHGISLSAIRCAGLEQFKAVTNKLLASVKDSITEEKLSSITQYVNQGLSYFDYYNPHYYDLKAFMHEVLPENDYYIWLQSFSTILAAMKDCEFVYMSGASSIYIDQQYSCGISVVLPPAGYTTNQQILDTYYNLEWRLW